MGWFNDLLGSNNTKLTDQDIAMDMLKDSKFALGALAMAIPETSNPELRQILKKSMGEAVKAHFRLSDIAINNDWYKPGLNPQEQLQRDYTTSVNVMEQR